MSDRKRRRELLRGAAVGAGAGAVALLGGCRKEQNCPESPARSGSSPRATASAEEYVWVSAMASHPLFVAHDHPALFQIGRELGVKVTVAGPNTVDIPGLIATIEQVAARKPAGLLVVGWEPSALIPPINAAVDAGIPVVCVDADVPASRRVSFVGTDWYDLGVRQAHAMVAALAGRRGKVAMLGLIEQEIDQRAFAGFRSVAEKAGLTMMEPQGDK